MEKDFFRDFAERKQDHIRLALDPSHQALSQAGFDRVRLPHDAMPELSWDELSLDSTSLGLKIPTVYFVAGMTAGHEQAYAINRVLAEACEQREWGMGIGSQRRELESHWKGVDYLGDGWGEIRRACPRLKLFGNIGLGQLIELSDKKDFSVLVALAERLEASAWVVHLNVLQEIFQPEGRPFFRGGIEALEGAAAALRLRGIPLVVKETGCGFSIAAVQKLRGIGIEAIDVSGLGGTHWGRIEGSRNKVGNEVRRDAAETFRDWGISTVESVRNVNRVAPELEIWGSGGVRSGLDAAKLVALGCSRIGFAQPALLAAIEGEAELCRWMEQMEFELKTALICTGCKNPLDLRWKGEIWARNE